MRGKVAKRLRKQAHSIAVPVRPRREVDGSVRHPKNTPRHFYQEMKKLWRAGKLRES